MESLKEWLTSNGRSMETLIEYVQHYMEQHWATVWGDNKEELEAIYADKGEPAYGVYCHRLFHPLTRELYDAGLRPQPVLPGSFEQSEERWGPWEERERRFWSRIYVDEDQLFGKLGTSFYHDHTQFRVPQPPRVYPLHDTDGMEPS